MFTSRAFPLWPLCLLCASVVNLTVLQTKRFDPICGVEPLDSSVKVMDDEVGRDEVGQDEVGYVAMRRYSSLASTTTSPSH